MLTYAERPNFGGKCRLQKIETTDNKTALELFLHLIFIFKKQQWSVVYDYCAYSFSAYCGYPFL